MFYWFGNGYQLEAILPDKLRMPKITYSNVDISRLILPFKPHPFSKHTNAKPTAQRVQRKILSKNIKTKKGT